MTKKLMMFSIAALCLFVSQAAFADQCAPLGNAPGCNLIITITNGPGNTLVASAAVGAGGANWYDGVEDTLVGVNNMSNATVNSIGLTSSNDIFGFDGDGAFGGGTSCITTTIHLFGPCGTGGDNLQWSGSIAGDDFYNGTGNHFVILSVFNGSVVFTNGLASGGQSEFSLEGNPGVSGISFTNVNPVPEPGTMALFGSGLIGLAGSLRRKLKA